MEFRAFSETELNTFSKETLVSLYLQIASSFQLLAAQNEQIMQQNKEIAQQNKEQSKQITKLQEELAILVNYRFGRKSERTKDIIDGQIVMDANGDILAFDKKDFYTYIDDNEKSDEELLTEAKERAEKRKRKKGQRDRDLRFATRIPEDYALTEEELNKLFPEGYTELPYKTSLRVEVDPLKVTVYEERIHQYKSKRYTRFASGKKPKHLLSHSVLTPSLAAKIFFDKYINAVPINRIIKEFEWLDIPIEDSTMAGWMINITEKYLYRITDRLEIWMKKKARLIHADETPFICLEDQKKEGRSKNSKSYMWVFHTADQYGSPPIFVYRYKDNRRTENIDEFLSGYHGILMADGYEPYHTVARKSNGDIVVAGCWAHLKRKFAEVIKTDPKNAMGTVAYEGNKRIAKIYKIDNMMKGALEKDRLAYRREKVAPLVKNFFEWVKEMDGKCASVATQKALTYAINQESYLREFLKSGIIPLDNSDAERSIRSFCLGKKNWNISASSEGAESNAKLYSLAETTKANGLKPFDYMKYLLEQLLENEDKLTNELIDSLLPWSESLPENLKRKDL